jgi:hypothetical protein
MSKFHPQRTGGEHRRGAAAKTVPGFVRPRFPIVPGFPPIETVPTVNKPNNGAGLLAGAGGLEPPNGGIKILDTCLL